MNMILNVDSYKHGHFLMYPPGTSHVSSYIEARGSDDPDFKSTLFFGLQMFLKEYLSKPITMEDVLEAKAIVEAHGEPFNFEGWKHIVTEHGGYIPVIVEAVPEGSIVPLNNVLVQVMNTDPMVPWITSFIETAILRAVWYPTTVATQSWTIRKCLQAYAEKCGSVEGVDFKLHDFGARGASSAETSMIGGLAHLASGALGTDTVLSLVAARRYYNEENIAGYSVPAAEHSTITAWGEDNEVDAYKNMLGQFAKPGSIVAVVSDSYNIERAVNDIWGDALKDHVVNSGATIVIRPDSGNPVSMPILVIKWLMEKFGYSVNIKGYKTLPSWVRVIQGDGINKDSIKEIIAALNANRFSLDNIAFGMGGALLQQVNRDTLNFAMKASAAKINGRWVDVYKRPVGDPTKASKKGRLGLIYEDGIYQTVRVEDCDVDNNALQLVYSNGVIQSTTTLSKVRERAAQSPHTNRR